ncbi:MAG: hypothetical protein KBC30_10885 [Planctomycetes bacterium]|nr:hypothetical protein [Planctomycetota bacterium]
MNFAGIDEAGKGCVLGALVKRCVIKVVALLLKHKR